MSSTSRRLLGHARHLLEREQAPLVGVWSRASALLIRQALEEALARFWRRFQPGVENAAVWSQLRCFPDYLKSDPELAFRAAWAWHRLSRACHAHPYDLAPGAPEILQWIEQVEAIIDEVERLVPPGPGPSQKVAPR